MNDARGQLPVDVWLKYVCEHNGERSEVLSWCVDPDDPDIAPTDPQLAVDQALRLVTEVIGHLPDSPEEALEAARRAVGILVHGSSEYQRGRGQAASMQHLAVRAWIIRKFNPHPKKPDDSTVGFALLADKFFLKDGKCSRITHDTRDNDGRPEHLYTSPCVKALMTGVGNLKSAMKRDGIPI
ncbi:MAG TPA: hypothetical protein VKH40_00430 [Alloacidobacterium sp.]|nr:hypothetical protein [Alloacidobacterium sp.]